MHARSMPLALVLSAVTFGCGGSPTGKASAPGPHDHGASPSPTGGRTGAPTTPAGGEPAGPTAGSTGTPSGGSAGAAGGAGGATGTGAMRSDAAVTDAASADAAPGADGPPAAAGGAGLLGTGAPKLVVLPTVARCLAAPWDLAFNPRAPGQLWIVNHGDDSVCIVNDATGAASKSENRLSPGHEHFMPRPSGIAFGGDRTSFGVPGTFATANDSAGDGSPDDGGLWNGITLWPSDLGTFAVFKGPDGNAHLDMLHDSPLARGIAWERDNVYWVFGATLSDITRYDFGADHNRGFSDHSDGKQWHYAAGLVKGVTGVASHLVYDDASKSLFIADTGNRRVARLDTVSGTMSPTRHTRAKDRRETLIDAVMLNARLTDVVPPAGGLEAPSGIELHDGVLYVSDNATGVIHAFDVAGKRLGMLDTRAGAGAVMGLAVGPDRKLYFVNAKASTVTRIEP